MDQFARFESGIESQVRIPWNRAYVWFLTVVPMFGIIGHNIKKPAQFSFRNMRKNNVELDKCDIGFFETRDSSKKSSTLPQLMGCKINESTVSLPRGGQVEFTDDYKGAEVGEIRQVRIKFRDTKTNEEILHTLDVDSDWALCWAPINK